MENYHNWLKLLKEKIRIAQIKSAVQVNSTLIALYWDIGKMIFEKQNSSDWGSKVIDRIALDLKKEFPDTSGFSRTNLFSMRKFYLFYHNSELVHQLGGQLNDESKSSGSEEDIIVHQVGGQLNNINVLLQIPWRHHVLIINKTNNFDALQNSNKLKLEYWFYDIEKRTFKTL